MEQNKINELLKRQWTILPEDIRTLVLSTDFETKLNWVGGKYNLTAEQIDILKQETVFVLIGLTELAGFMDSVSSELVISKEQARVISQEVGTQVFAGVKESLKEMDLIMEIVQEVQRGNVPTDIKKPVSGVLIQQAEKKEEEIPKINRAVLLQEIEHPALIEAHAQMNTIVDEKLSGMVKISRQEAHIDMTKIPPQKYTGADPYRESV